MNPGRFTFTVRPEQHAKAVIDKLGFETETYGHWTHGLRHEIRQYEPFYSIDEYRVNKMKKIMKKENEEEAARKAKEEKNAPKEKPIL